MQKVRIVEAFHNALEGLARRQGVMFPYPIEQITRLEIEPVRSNEEKNGTTYCEVCPPAEAEFYGVYARYANGEAHIVLDLTTPAAIEAVIAIIDAKGI